MTALLSEVDTITQCRSLDDLQSLGLQREKDWELLPAKERKVLREHFMAAAVRFLRLERAQRTGEET